MQRRNFMQQSVLAGASLFTASLAKAGTSNAAIDTDKLFNLNYGIHDGMFKNSAGNDFIDQIKYGYDHGFRAIEDNGMMARPVEQQKKIGDALAALGMTMGVFVVDGGDNWKTSLTSGKQQFLDTFLKTCRDAVDVAKRCNAKWMTVVPGFYDRSLSVEYQAANVIGALRKASEIFEPHGLVMVIESLSDTPELFLRHSDQAYTICKAVNSPSCKFLFDMYHMQRNEGNIINNLDASWEAVAYIQIGDNPARKEPGTGEMNYKNIFKHIHSKDYKGVLGMEHGNSIPGKEGEARMIEAYRESDDFV